MGGWMLLGALLGLITILWPIIRHIERKGKDD